MEGIALIIGISCFLTPGITALNVAGDMISALYVDRKEKQKEIFSSI